LFGVSPSDAGTLIFAVTMLASVALVASWWPARRAARIDPVIALRSE
jgi:ABC-type lipoprotein release transport system permease subunit